MSEGLSRALQQVGVLVWKNFTLRRQSLRNALLALLEVLLPVLVVILVRVRDGVPDTTTPASLHTADAVTASPALTSAYLAWYPSLNLSSPPNLQKIAFLSPLPPFSSSPSPLLSPLVSAFASAYPVLNASILTILPPPYTSLDSYISSDTYGRDPSHPYLVAAVTIDRFGSADNAYQWAYTLHLNASGSTVATDQAAVSPQWTGDDGTYALYMQGGQVFLQQFMDSYILSTAPRSINPTLPVPLTSPNLTAIPMPTPAYTSNTFQSIVGTFLGLMLILVYNWTAILIIRVLVNDKQLRFREQMRMMGVSDAVMFASWAATYSIIFAVTSVLICVVGGSTIFGGVGLVTLFLLLFLFEWTVFAYCCLVASVFDTAQTAAMVGSVGFLIISLPFYAVDRSSLTQQTLACLSAPICFCESVTAILIGSAEHNPFSLAIAFPMLLLDVAIYLLLASYIDQVMPTEYGTQKPWHFPFHLSYWTRRTPSTSPSHPSNSLSEPLNPSFSSSSSSLSPCPEAHVELPPPSLLSRQALHLRGLTKTFPRTGSGLTSSPPKLAVDSLTVDMYDGQIFGLLGVNGAGKTTTINILTGMVPATGGTAEVFGLDVSKDMEAIRRLIGVCPQHNVLYDRLTVRQHLVLFARVKGMRMEQVQTAVTDMSRDAELLPFLDQYVESLSGGQKRKLSVSLALLGDNRVVFLDEPTAGMDPASRRSAWALLEKKKAGRLIILTTHSMEEADRLSDRIAIMASGRLQCCGSSLFLKRTYGAGYSLDVLHEPDEGGQAGIVGCVHRHIPEAEVVSRVPMEVVMKVRFDRAAAFPALLEELDQQRPAWGINSVSVEPTTLEEIFLKVAQTASEAEKEGGGGDGREEEEKQDGGGDGVLSHGVGANGYAGVSARPSALHLFGLQLYALFVKRYIHSRRSPRMWRFAIGTPLILTLIGGAIRTKTPGAFPIKAMTTSDYSPLLLPMLNTSSSPLLPPPLWSSLGVDTVMPLSPLALNLTSPAVPLGQTTIDGMAQWLWSSVTSGGGGPYYGAYAASTEGGVGQLQLFVNTSAVFSLPSFLNLYDTALLRSATGSANASILTSVQPFPRTLQEQSLSNAFTTPIFLSIALSAVSSFFAFYAVYERKSGVQHLQHISGLTPAAYWLGHWLFDYLTFLFTATLILLTLSAFGTPDLLSLAALPVTLLTIVLYGLAIVPFAYAFSTPFKDPVMAQGLLMALCSVTSGYLVTLSLILDLLPSTRATNATLKFFYRLLPPFCLGEIITGLSSRTVVIIYGRVMPIWSFDLIGWPMVYLLVDVIVFSLLLGLRAHWRRAYNLLRQSWQQRHDAEGGWQRVDGGAGVPVDVSPVQVEDPEVVAERERLSASTGPIEGEQVTVRGLRVVYPAQGKTSAKVALDDVYLSVRGSECLGLLGVNGAGKTSLLKVLTNEVLPTRGSMFLAGIDPAVDPAAVYQRVGYCPQFDALIDELTGRDHLTLFARIKGVHGAALPRLVQHLVSRLDLQVGVIDRPVKEYSGGNKRKLCVGLALIGEPSIVFLDEPSTGVDPFSRRLMWSLISSTMRGRSVILTSHLMEEVEALCQRIAILSHGRLQCTGTSKQLIARYGDNLEVHVQVKDPAVKATVVDAIRRTLPAAQCAQVDDVTMRWQVPASAEFAGGWEGRGGGGGMTLGGGGRGGVTVGRLFGWMEGIKTSVASGEGGMDYTVRQQTLEQVFLRLAALDAVEREEV